MNRTVKPDGNKIKKLRATKGMSADTLAEVSGCSERTIASLESGQNNCFIYTLNKVAQALGVECGDVIANADQKDAKEKAKEPIRILLEIHLPTDFADFTETTIPSLLKALAAIAGTKSLMELVRVESGTTILTISVTESDAFRLIAACKDDLLSLFHIAGLRFVKRMELRMILSPTFAFDLTDSAALEIRDTEDY
jgi:transcriptional regulator with XRE-family HTH domain